VHKTDIISSFILNFFFQQVFLELAERIISSDRHKNGNLPGERGKCCLGM